MSLHDGESHVLTCLICTAPLSHDNSRLSLLRSSDIHVLLAQSVCCGLSVELRLNLCTFLEVRKFACFRESDELCAVEKVNNNIFSTYILTHTSSCVVICDNCNEDKIIATLLTRNLLQNLHLEKIITGRNCWIFLFEESHADSTIIDWSILSNLEEPLQHFYEVANVYLSNYQALPANSKFNSNCWFTGIVVISPDFMNIRSSIGHPTRDEYIFISKSESLLINFMSSSYVLNGFARKYGTFPEH